MKEHLACTHKNVRPCPKVPDDVKKEINDYMNKWAVEKRVAHQKFEEMVDVGSYYGDGFVGSCQSPQVVSDRVRGPMDKFLNNVVDDKEANERPSLRTTSREKEARFRVCLDIGRFFYENALAFNIAKSPSYFNMCRSIGDYGRSLVSPSMHELRTWILKEEVLTIEKFMEEVKRLGNKQEFLFYLMVGRMLEIEV